MLSLVVAGGPVVLHRAGHHFVLNGGVVMNLLDPESECFVQCKYVIKGRRFGGHRFGPVGHRPECLVDQGHDIDGVFERVDVFSRHYITLKTFRTLDRLGHRLRLADVTRQITQQSVLFGGKVLGDPVDDPALVVGFMVDQQRADGL